MTITVAGIDVKDNKIELSHSATMKSVPDLGYTNEVKNSVTKAVSLQATDGGIQGTIVLPNELRATLLEELTINASSKGFSSLMDMSEALRYNKYWQNYAPKQISPGTTRLDWIRESGRTGRIENSRVIYDNYGRQIYRVDFSNHMRPINHSVPHLHQYNYGPMSSFGQESVFNFF